MTADTPTPELTRLAEAYGIATEYWSFFGERVHVPAPTLRAVLAAMGVDDATASQAIRISFGWNSQPADSDRLIAAWRDLYVRAGRSGIENARAA